MTTSSVFHEGELSVQERAGATAQGRNNGRMISNKIIPGAIKFVGKQPFAILGSVDEQDHLWSSIVVGKTGFMFAESQSLDIDLSQISRVKADPLWHNLATESRVGMLVVDLRSRARLRVNGRAEFHATKPAEQGATGTSRSNAPCKSKTLSPDRPNSSTTHRTTLCRSADCNV